MRLDLDRTCTRSPTWKLGLSTGLSFRRNGRPGADGSSDSNHLRPSVDIGFMEICVPRGCSPFKFIAISVSTVKPKQSTVSSACCIAQGEAEGMSTCITRTSSAPQPKVRGVGDLAVRFRHHRIHRFLLGAELHSGFHHGFGGHSCVLGRQVLICAEFLLGSVCHVDLGFCSPNQTSSV